MDKINILYVDDEPDLLEIGKLFLEQLDENFVVDTIISANMAMRHLHKHVYDVIVSDYSMPEMDGIEFLKHLKSSGNKTPFIIFTGRGREEIVIKAFDEGADYYVQKGGEVHSQYAELAHKIRKSVEHRRMHVEQYKSELRFKNVIESINQYVFEMDAHATITFVSNRVKDVLGYEPHEILGKTPLDQLYSSEEVSRVSEIFVNYSKGKPGVHKMEYICKSKNGEKVIIKIVAVPILNTTGKVTGYQGVAEDITALKSNN
jgi:PAS domain S-box-containing protein